MRQSWEWFWQLWLYDNYSVIKEEKLAIYANMDGPWKYYAKWNKSDKEKYHMISLNVESEKKKQNPKHPKSNS